MQKSGIDMEINSVLKNQNELWNAYNAYMSLVQKPWDGKDKGTPPLSIFQKEFLQWIQSTDTKLCINRLRFVSNSNITPSCNIAIGLQFGENYFDFNIGEDSIRITLSSIGGIREIELRFVQSTKFADKHFDWEYISHLLAVYLQVSSRKVQEDPEYIHKLLCTYFPQVQDIKF